LSPELSPLVIPYTKTAICCPSKNIGMFAISCVR
jgi:hypothetical protein